MQFLIIEVPTLNQETPQGAQPREEEIEETTPEIEGREEEALTPEQTAGM